MCLKQVKNDPPKADIANPATPKAGAELCDSVTACPQQRVEHCCRFHFQFSCFLIIGGER
jgi:hypothetical protein